jgi:3-hydroxybutyryl-CoA dehydratase
MESFPVHIGDQVTFSKTVSESDVYLFAGITGDLSPNHVNEEFMRRTRFGQRIVHGALLVGYMSNCSTALCAHTQSSDETPVSLGYDRIRFIAPVFIGDTIHITYRITEVDPVKRESKAEVRVMARGELCAIAMHILRWVPNQKELSV